MTDESCPAFKELEPYDVALSKAWEDLEARDAQEVAKSSTSLFEAGKFRFKALAKECIVDLNSKVVYFGGREPQPLAKVTILHYLANCPPITPTGKSVSYRDLPNGQILYPAFKRRVIEPIAHLYQSKPQLLISAGIKLGGKKLNLGSSSILLLPLSKLPVTVITWRADNEVHGSANLLFDETAGRILPAEDLAQVGWFVFSELRKITTSISKEVMDRNDL